MGKRSSSSQVSDEEATESWSDQNTRVQVTQPQGFMCQVRVMPCFCRKRKWLVLQLGVSLLGLFNLCRSAGPWSWGGAS